ncbi:hypothetical protein BJ742DRAFT_777241 [Cladochytrium replicatum]|nr:hypothetical protein BJ742DRAFT_777241 [Cladochytrium replicatum]
MKCFRFLILLVIASWATLSVVVAGPVPDDIPANPSPAQSEPEPVPTEAADTPKSVADDPNQGDQFVPPGYGRPRPPFYRPPFYRPPFPPSYPPFYRPPFPPRFPGRTFSESDVTAMVAASPDIATPADTNDKTVNADYFFPGHFVGGRFFGGSPFVPFSDAADAEEAYGAAADDGNNNQADTFFPPYYRPPYFYRPFPPFFPPYYRPPFFRPPYRPFDNKETNDAPA